MTTDWRVPVDGESTSAVYESAGPNAPLAILAHGAGGRMSDRSMLAATDALVRHGISVVRFNFLYVEKGSRRPDFMPRLKATIAAVVEHARRELGNVGGSLVIGGRSMGGRAASMLAADGYAADGLLLLAYPLHPAGKPEQLRDAHLPKIRMPVLAFSGTRDPLCTRGLMEHALTTVTAPWDMRWIEGADHSFHVLKSSGRTDAQVHDEIGAVSKDWTGRLRG